MGYDVAGRIRTAVCGGGTVARQILGIFGETDRFKGDPSVKLKVAVLGS